MGVDPEEAEQREEKQPARVRPRLREEEQLQWKPDQGEIEPPVARHDPGDASGEHEDDGDDPAAPRPQGAGVGGRDDETEPAQDDGVEAVGQVPEATEQHGEGVLGAPLVRHPAPVRLCVAERVETHEGVMGQHPLTGRQRPELVVGQVVSAGHPCDKADPDDHADDLNGALWDRAATTVAARRSVRRTCSDSSGAGRRHMEFLDDPGARLHCSPLTPVPHRSPCVHGTTRPDSPASPDGCDPVASRSLNRSAARRAP